MKFFFDDSYIIDLSEGGVIKIKLGQADKDRYLNTLKLAFKKRKFQFFTLFDGILNKTLKVDVTLDFPSLGMGQVECEHCHTINNFIADGNADKDKIVNPEYQPKNLKCQGCGNKI